MIDKRDRERTVVIIGNTTDGPLKTVIGVDHRAVRNDGAIDGRAQSTVTNGLTLKTDGRDLIVARKEEGIIRWRVGPIKNERVVERVTGGALGFQPIDRIVDCAGVGGIRNVNQRVADQEFSRTLPGAAVA